MPKTKDNLLTVEEAPEPPMPGPSPLVDFQEPIAPKDLVAAVEDAPEVVLTPEQLDAMHAAARRDNDKFNFVQRVMEARKPKQEDAVSQPVAPRILDQTKAEMEEGRAQVTRHAAQQASRPKPVTSPSEGTNQAVFRPGDFTEYKNTFKSPQQTVSKDSGARAMG